MVAGAVVSTAFQLLADQFPVGHPVSAMAANLSGMSIGGLSMVLGFIRDGRVEEARKRTEEERQRTADAEARVQQATIKAATAAAQLALERARAAAAEARAERLMDRYEAVTEALIRRLERRNGDDAKE